MHIPPAISESICFVCIGTTREDMRPIGTAFFVAYPVADGSELSFVYVVTARHVIAAAVAGGQHSVYLRMDQVAGGIGYQRVPIGSWVFHPDVSVADDLAIAAAAPDKAVYRYMLLDVSMIATDEELANLSIGPGDEVFLPGLFVNHFGTERNLPIMRMGSIAAMPVEPVATRIGDLKAYLVEARSIGGLSGSPVFVNVGLIRLPPDTVLLSTREESAPQGPAFLLLGMMHGHFAVRAPTPDEVVADALPDETINMGIAIVVPGTRIREIIDGPELTASRTDREDA